MLSLFLAITAFNLLCLLLAALLGYSYGGSPVTQWHPVAGIVATLTCVGCHCVVFTYFVATAKWVRHAVAVKQLDPNLAAPTRSFKRQAFPAALLAMASVFAAAVLGAARVNYDVAPAWHHAGAWAAIGVNVVVAAIEYRAIARNGRLIDGILETINGPAAFAPSPAARR